ncbi:homeobox protein GBX-2-like protein [Lates japonicus]|uniref:Homeobox protein GBX-2-like protein n=1 Tax=Lates japonicus TaxID=270547 RepID=A0AAD3N8R0_LATJO|nr:homeobox protein GBX-2-like protein [Lates japonicus]
MDSDLDYSSDDNLTSMCHKERTATAAARGSGRQRAPHGSAGGGGEAPEAARRRGAQRRRQQNRRQRTAFTSEQLERRKNRRAKWKRVKAGNVGCFKSGPSRNPKIIPIPVRVSRFAIRSAFAQMEQARP